MQGDKNYLAPIDEASRPVQGLEKRLLDVGTGRSNHFSICLPLMLMSRHGNMVCTYATFPFAAAARVEADFHRAIEMAKEFPHVQVMVSQPSSTTTRDPS